MPQETTEKFKTYFSKMALGDDAALDQIYAANVKFADPIHRIEGIAKLKSYFKKLNSNLAEGSFRFTKESVCANDVYGGRWTCC